MITILLFLVSIVIGGFSLFKVGLQNLTRFDFDMKTLMTVAVIGAAIIGQWSEAAVVVILFAISEALERFSMEKARKSIRSLMNIAPREAIVLRNGHELIVPVEQIKIGDIMIVKPGQKIAMDGVVVKGNSSVNQAAITGESVPVTKTKEDEVFAGTLNEAGVLEVKVTKYVEDTTISKIIHLVEEAQGERAPSQAFVDKFAKYYTPIIMMIALFVVIIPPIFFGASFSTWLYQGLSILVVGCPCALVISTPITIVSAIGNAAKKGVLIKGGNYLEEMGSLKAIAFDKTGTLTKGVPVVTDFEVFEPNVDENEVLALIAALENRSQHPLASAILQKVEGLHISYRSINVENFSSITGKGVKGFINQLEYLIGSPKLFEELQVDLSEDILAHMRKFQSESKTVMFFGTNQRIIAILAITDIIRVSSEEVISKLHEMGIKKTVMLTGDNIGTANSIGQGIGISEIRAELMPEEKLAMIKDLRKEFGKVAMIGDGVNDAPALAASNVGIAMGVLERIQLLKQRMLP